MFKKIGIWLVSWFVKADKTVVIEKDWYKSKKVQAFVVTFLVSAYVAIRPLAAQYGYNLPEIPPAVITLLTGLGLYQIRNSNSVIK